MPITTIAKLRYDDLINVTSATSVLGSHVFRANSIYDPDYSGTGHQPMGHDEWAQLYNHYVVLGSKIVATVTVPSDADIYWTGAYLSDTVTVPYTTGTAFREARKGLTKFCNAGDNCTNHVRAMYSPKKFFQVKDVMDNVTRLGASTGYNPSEEAAFIIWVQALNASTVAATIAIHIEYTVQFSEPKDLVQS